LADLRTIAVMAEGKVAPGELWLAAAVGLVLLDEEREIHVGITTRLMFLQGELCSCLPTAAIYDGQWDRLPLARRLRAFALPYLRMCFAPVIIV
jgi:hypothetical protein